MTSKIGWSAEDHRAEYLSTLCEECGHAILYHCGRYGCSAERGDVQVQEVGAVALPPCSCKAHSRDEAQP